MADQADPGSGGLINPGSPNESVKIGISMKSRITKYASDADLASGVPYEILDQSVQLSTRDVLTLVVQDPAGVTVSQLTQCVDKLEPTMAPPEKAALVTEFNQMAQDLLHLTR